MTLKSENASLLWYTYVDFVAKTVEKFLTKASCVKFVDSFDNSSVLIIISCIHDIMESILEKNDVYRGLLSNEN